MLQYCTGLKSANLNIKKIHNIVKTSEKIYVFKIGKSKMLISFASAKICSEGRSLLLLFITKFSFL